MRIGHESSSAVIKTTKYRAVASAEESGWDYFLGRLAVNCQEHCLL